MSKQAKEECLKAYILQHAKEKVNHRIRNEDRKTLIQQDFNARNKFKPQK